MAEHKRRHYADAWNRHEPSGRFVFPCELAHPPIKPVQFATHIRMDGDQRQQHWPKDMSFARQFLHPAPELPADRARNDPAALLQHGAHLLAGKIEACSYARFQEMTGLTLDEADGTMKENLPPIQQFLNRCLALRIDMQDAIFEAFGGFLSAIIEDARQAGTLDVGLETLKAEKFVISDRKVIFEHEATGATATALTVERTDRNDPLNLPRVKAICADTKGATLCWNKTSKRAALMVKAPAFMDEDGVPILRVKLLRPMATEILALSEFSKSHWEGVDDAMFDQLWQAEVDAVPEFTTSKITLICGLLLPIWDRLPADNMRIYRLQTEDGERAIGRLVSQEQLLNVYARLGLDCQMDMTPQEVFAAVIDGKTTLSLLGGYKLRRSLVMGQPRLELTGASGVALPALKALGCFTEVIQWKTRVFIPVDGIDVLACVLAEHPVGASGADAAA
ncbi:MULTISPECIES: strawberry notch C-terminal domain-containing protein [Salipiger]|nr:MULTISPECIES: strawberry notch C-terminal domain-containing protein [Salipiger]